MSQKCQRFLQRLWFWRWRTIVLTLLIGLATIVLTPHLPIYQTVQPTLAQDMEFEANRLSLLGLNYIQQKKYPEAIAAFRESVALATANPNPGGQGTKTIALNNLGAALYLNKQLPEAEQVFREAMAVMEALREQQQGNELLTIQFFDNQQSFLYRTLQQVLVEQGKVAEALEIAERGRARILIEQLIRQRSRQSATTSGPPSGSAMPITVQQMQQIAKTQNLTLVEYSLFPNTSEIFIPGREQDELRNQPVKLYIWVVQPTGKIQFKSVDLTAPQWRNRTIAERVVATRKSMGVTGRGQSIEIVPLTPEESLNQLQELHKLLIEPIAKFLPDPNAHIAFIPQESLFLVPFAALKDPSGKYLVEKYPILTAPSIQTLALTRQQRQRLGNQDTIQPKDALIVGVSDSQTVQRAGRTETLPPLGAVEAEARAIMQVFKSQALLGRQATKAAVLAQMPQAKVIHLAAHGLLDDFKGVGIPGAIALFPTGKQPNDGLLTADEIVNLNLKAELVVLSACDTGRGSISGDGVIGLSRSLLRAGVPSVIVSLWSVPDAPTAELMVEFYRNWRERKLDKAQAVRQAMLTTMKIHPNPRNWAAFTLIGEAE